MGGADIGSDGAYSYCDGMIDTNVVYPVLAFIAIYAVVFFLVPRRVAEFWERDGLPVHTIMQHFHFWERRRIWLAAVSLTACLLLSPAFGSSVLFMVGVFLGLACLGCVDALQLRAISRHHLSVR